MEFSRDIKSGGLAVLYGSLPFLLLMANVYSFGLLECPEHHSVYLGLLLGFPVSIGAMVPGMYHAARAWGFQGGAAAERHSRSGRRWVRASILCGIVAFIDVWQAAVV